MNLRHVLRAFGLLRQLTDDETALLETLRNLNDTERELLMESLGPQKRAAKKPASKAASKSRRAASLGAAIQGTATGKPHLGEGPFCMVCSHVEDYEDHQHPSPHYHPFVPPARSAASQSSPNGANGPSTASSVTGTEDAGIAVNAGG